MSLATVFFNGIVEMLDLTCFNNIAAVPVIVSMLLMACKTAKLVHQFVNCPAPEHDWL